MATERPDAGKNYQPLPTPKIRKENSAVLAIDVQIAQISRQLTQLIDQLQRLNNQIHSFQQDEKTTSTSNPLQAKTEYGTKNHVVLTRKYQTTEIELKKLGKRRRFSNFINGVFIFLAVIGIAAALFAAIVLFFHGPAMI